MSLGIGWQLLVLKYEHSAGMGQLSIGLCCTAAFFIALVMLVSAEDSSSEIALLGKELAELRQQVTAMQESLNSQNRAFWKRLQNSMHAMSLLQYFSPLAAPFPTFNVWSLAPDNAETLVFRVASHRPQVVVEFGSGISTLMMALTMKHVTLYSIICNSFVENITLRGKSIPLTIIRILQTSRRRLLNYMVYLSLLSSMLCH